MTTEEYNKKLEKAKRYAEHMRQKQIERINSSEYKEKKLKQARLQQERNKTKYANKFYKAIKSHQKTAKKLKSEYFSIFGSMNICAITGSNENVVPHHIFNKSDKAFSEKYGFILPLRSDWHTGTNYSIHSDKNLWNKYKIKCQEYYLQNIGTKEDWLKECSYWTLEDSICN